MTDFEELLRLLTKHEVAFIVIGGVAAVLHGSSRLTQDLDIVYQRTPENIARLAAALAGRSPYPREAPPGLPFRWSEATLRMGLNFTLDTSLGALDLLGEVTGGGSYEQLLDQSIEADLSGVRCRCLDLESLIRVKRAAGRPKDFEAIAELEAIQEEQDLQ
jgi:predicted nucleotidyltransferase